MEKLWITKMSKWKADYGLWLFSIPHSINTDRTFGIVYVGTKKKNLV